MPFSAKKSTHRRSGAARRRETITGWVLILLSAVILLACWRFGMQPRYESVNVSPDTPGDVDRELKYLALTDVDRDTSAEGAEKLDLNEAENEVVITSGKPVILTGSFSGTVRVQAPEQTVHLVLANAQITAESGSAILVEEADRVIITLQDGTRNVIKDSGRYPAGAENDGCIYAACDLTLNGTGSLEVNGLYQDAIRSVDRVKIVDGTYRVTAKRNAIRGNDGVRIAGGTLFLGSEKNGVMTTKQGPDGRGDLIVSGGDLTVVAGRYAFVADKAQLYMLDCTVHTNAAAGDFDVHGTRYIEDGCLQ